MYCDVWRVFEFFWHRLRRYSIVFRLHYNRTFFPAAVHLSSVTLIIDRQVPSSIINPFCLFHSASEGPSGVQKAGTVARSQAHETGTATEIYLTEYQGCWIGTSEPIFWLLSQANVGQNQSKKTEKLPLVVTICI